MSKMLDDISYLSQEIGPRPAGTEEEQQAALYIADRLEKSTGFTADIEDFSCASSSDLIEPILFGLPAIFALLAMVLNGFAVIAMLVAIVCAVLFLMEVFDRPVLSRLLERGVSQNVVAKYTPGSQSSARARKVILVANYDSGKVRAEYGGSLRRAWPMLRKASIVGLVALAIIWIIRALFLPGLMGTAASIWNLINIVAVLCALIPVVTFALHKSAAYNEAANSNAAGVAALIEIAQRVSSGMVSEDELAARAQAAAAEQEAYEAGLVPEGASISYDAGAASSERLAQAKRAVAAMGGRPESGYQSHDDEFEAAQEAEAWEQGAADEGFAPAAEAAPQGAATDEAFDEISDEEMLFYYGEAYEEDADEASWDGPDRSRWEQAQSDADIYRETDYPAQRQQRFGQAGAAEALDGEGSDAADYDADRFAGQAPSDEEAQADGQQPSAPAWQDAAADQAPEPEAGFAPQPYAAGEAAARPAGSEWAADRAGDTVRFGQLEGAVAAAAQGAAPAAGTPGAPAAAAPAADFAFAPEPAAAPEPPAPAIPASMRSAYAGLPTSSDTYLNRSSQQVAGYDKAPEWFRTAQEKAKRPDLSSTPVRRSQYADALEAALETSQSHFDEANRLVSREAAERLNVLRADIAEVQPPSIADLIERKAAAEQEEALLQEREAAEQQQAQDLGTAVMAEREGEPDAAEQAEGGVRPHWGERLRAAELEEWDDDAPMRSQAQETPGERIEALFDFTKPRADYSEFEEFEGEDAAPETETQAAAAEGIDGELQQVFGTADGQAADEGEARAEEELVAEDEFLESYFDYGDSTAQEGSDYAQGEADEAEAAEAEAEGAYDAANEDDEDAQAYADEAEGEEAYDYAEAEGEEPYGYEGEGGGGYDYADDEAGAIAEDTGADSDYDVYEEYEDYDGEEPVEEDLWESDQAVEDQNWRGTQDEEEEARSRGFAARRGSRFDSVERTSWRQAFNGSSFVNRIKPDQTEPPATYIPAGALTDPSAEPPATYAPFVDRIVSLEEIEEEEARIRATDFATQDWREFDEDEALDYEDAYVGDRYEGDELADGEGEQYEDEPYEDEAYEGEGDEEDSYEDEPYDEADADEAAEGEAAEAANASAYESDSAYADEQAAEGDARPEDERRFAAPAYDAEDEDGDAVFDEAGFSDYETEYELEDYEDEEEGAEQAAAEADEPEDLELAEDEAVQPGAEEPAVAEDEAEAEEPEAAEDAYDVEPAEDEYDAGADDADERHWDLYEEDEESTPGRFEPIGRPRASAGGWMNRVRSAFNFNRGESEFKVVESEEEAQAIAEAYSTPEPPASPYEGTSWDDEDFEDDELDAAPEAAGQGYEDEAYDEAYEDEAYDADAALAEDEYTEGEYADDEYDEYDEDEAEAAAPERAPISVPAIATPDQTTAMDPIDVSALREKARVAREEAERAEEQSQALAGFDIMADEPEEPADEQVASGDRPWWSQGIEVIESDTDAASATGVYVRANEPLDPESHSWLDERAVVELGGENLVDEDHIAYDEDLEEEPVASDEVEDEEADEVAYDEVDELEYDEPDEYEESDVEVAEELEEPEAESADEHYEDMDDDLEVEFDQEPDQTYTIENQVDELDEHEEQYEQEVPAYDEDLDEDYEDDVEPLDEAEYVDEFEEADELAEDQAYEQVDELEEADESAEADEPANEPMTLFAEEDYADEKPGLFASLRERVSDAVETVKDKVEDVVDDAEDAIEDLFDRDDDGDRDHDDRYDDDNDYVEEADDAEDVYEDEAAYDVEEDYDEADAYVEEADDFAEDEFVAELEVEAEEETEAFDEAEPEAYAEPEPAYEGASFQDDFAPAEGAEVAAPAEPEPEPEAIDEPEPAEPEAFDEAEPVESEEALELAEPEEAAELAESEQPEEPEPAEPEQPADTPEPEPEPEPEPNYAARSAHKQPTLRTASSPSTQSLRDSLPMVGQSPAETGSFRMQPAPLAQDGSELRTRTLESGAIPRIDVGGGADAPSIPTNPPRSDWRAQLRNSLPSLSGELTPIQGNNSTVSTTGSFAPVGATGSFAPVGDELVANLDPENIYVDDADDSGFEAATTPSGAYAGPGYVDMPESRASRFFGRFRRRNNSNDEISASEWLDVDEDFNPTAVGAARGGWESFRTDDDDDAPRGRHGANTAADGDSEDEEDRWNGGAFSTERASQSFDSQDDIESETAMVHSFRNPDIDTEVWFVALGSELAGNGGMKAFLREHAHELRGSVIINLEALGAGDLTYLEAEGLVQPKKPSSRIRRYLQKAAQLTGITPARAKRDWTESAVSIAMRRGLQGMTLVGMDAGMAAYDGLGDDVVENIDEATLEENVDYVMNLIKNI